MRSRTFQPWSVTSRKVESNMRMREDEQDGYEYIIIGGPRSQVQRLREDPEIDVLVLEDPVTDSASSTSQQPNIIHALPERPKNRTSEQSHTKRTSNASSILSAFSDDADADDLSCIANGLSSSPPSSSSRTQSSSSSSSSVVQSLPKNHQLLCSELDALANGIELGAPREQKSMVNKDQEEEETGTQGWSHERRYLAYVYDGVDWSVQSSERGDDFGGDLANCL